MSYGRFTGVCLITDDVRRLARFYADLLAGTVDGDATFATVQQPGTAALAGLSFYPPDGMERMAPGSMMGAGRGAATVEIEVPAASEVDAVADRLAGTSVPVVKPPTTQAWGRRSVWFRDPDGNIVNVYALLPPRPDPATVVRSYFQRLLVERDLDVCDELLAAEYVDHDAPAGTPPGPAVTRTYVERMLRDHPDLRFEIDELIAEGQTVALRAHWRSATASWTGLAFLHVDPSGRIVERWSAYASD